MLKDKDDFRSCVLQKDIQLALNLQDEALSTCLDIIYSYLALIENDNYRDWKDFHNASLSACDLLISQKKYKAAQKLIERL